MVGHDDRAVALAMACQHLGEAPPDYGVPNLSLDELRKGPHVDLMERDRDW